MWNRSLVHGLAFKRHHSSVVSCVKFHPTLDILVSGSWDNTVLFHSVLVGSQVKAKRVASCTNMQVQTIDFSRDGTLMAIGGHGLRIYDMRTKEFIKKLPERKPTDHKRPRGKEMSHCCFSRDAKYLYCAEGQKINVYDVGLGQSVYIEDLKYRMNKKLGSISALKLSPNGKIMLGGHTTTGNLYIWKVKGFELIYETTINAHDSTINCIMFTADGRYFLTGSSDYDAKLWILEKDCRPTVVKRYLHEDEVLSLAVGACMDHSFENSRNFGSFQEDEFEQSFEEEIEMQPTMSSACTPSLFPTAKISRQIGRPILVTGGPHFVWVWDLQKGKTIKRFKEKVKINSVDISPYGDNIAIAADRSVELRSLTEGLETLKESESSLNSVV